LFGSVCEGFFGAKTNLKKPHKCFARVATKRLMAGAEMESGGLEKNQGDQIGRIFAGWAIASIGYFLKVPEVLG
jgi:hypothetical protein